MLLISLLRRLKSTFRTPSNNNNIRVAVIGACGAIGTNMSLLLKMNPLINEIILCDVSKKVDGITLDLSHISTPCEVKGHHIRDETDLNRSLLNCNIVMIAAGKRRKYDMKMTDLFNSNAATITRIIVMILRSCPKALIGILTSPVCALIPLVNKLIEKEDKGDWRRIFGVTTIDVIRSKTVIGEAKKLNPMVIDVPVIGGHSSDSIVPLISLATPSTKFADSEFKELTDRIRNIGNDIVKQKKDEDDGGGATISMAYAGARMTSSLARAVLGEKDIVECAFVRCNSLSTKYMCMPVVIDKDGIKEYQKIENLTDFEKKLLRLAIDDLRMYIKLGESYVK